MISALSKKRAACFAKCIIRTAPMAKFEATTAPTLRVAHSASSHARNSCERPVVPMTRWAPAGRVAAASPGVHAALVKSMTTSGRNS
jgi:hypothetical protein